MDGQSVISRARGRRGGVMRVKDEPAELEGDSEGEDIDVVSVKREVSSDSEGECRLGHVDTMEVKKEMVSDAEGEVDLEGGAAVSLERERLIVGAGLYTYDQVKEEREAEDDLEPSALVEVQYHEAEDIDQANEEDVNKALRTDAHPKTSDQREEGEEGVGCPHGPNDKTDKQPAGATDKSGPDAPPPGKSVKGRGGPRERERRSFRCEECGKCFTRNSSLTWHLVAHAGIRNYECHDCGKRFSKKYFLKQHMVIHTGVKNYQCEECGKCFTQKSTLNLHRVLHTGAARHGCEHCGLRFTRKDTLNRHIMSHTGVGNFKCEACGKLFLQRRLYDKHLVTHTGEKNFRCDECGKLFTQKSSLTRHRATHPPLC